MSHGHAPHAWPWGSQPLPLGMGVSLGLHLLMAGCLLLWPLGLPSPAEKPEEVQRVHLVELPPPPPPAPLPKPKLEPPPPPPKPQPPAPRPRLAPRVQLKPASTTRPSPVASAAQEKPVESTGPSVATMGEAISSSGPVAAPAGGGQLPLGKEEVPPAAVDWGPYNQTVWKRIEARKSYPLLARKRGREGRVTVDFVLGPGGRLLDARVGKSSGSEDLDQAALEAVRRAAPFPEPPAPPSGGRLPMQITVRFELTL